MKTATFFQKLENDTKRAVEARKWIASRLFRKAWTLAELERKTKALNKLKNKDSLAYRRLFFDLFEAKLIHEIRIPAIQPGSFESRTQAERNGPMIPGPRNYSIELDWSKNALIILKRDKFARYLSDQWFPEKIIHFSKFKDIRIVTVPAGLHHLEIQLHTPCPD